MARVRKERTGINLLKINRFANQSLILFKDGISAMRLFFLTIPKPLKQHPL
jgi:hypothetical protein